MRSKNRGKVRGIAWCAGLLVLLLAGCSSRPESSGVDPKVVDRGAAALSASDLGENSALQLKRPLTPLTGSFARLDGEQTGVNFRANCPPDHPMSRLYHSVFAAGGIAIADVDGDNRLDLFLANGPGNSRLYRQVADFQFEDVTSQSGLEQSDHWNVGASFVDIDNDGDQDLYVCNYNQPNEMWINDGQGRFVERAKAMGLDIQSASVMGYFADFNNDGWLDVYLLTNRLYYEKGLVKDFRVGQDAMGRLVLEPGLRDYFKLVPRSGGFSIREKGQPDRLLINQRGSHFRDVTETSGISDDGHGLSAVVWDCDQDGDQDIYVCNDFNDPDILYLNKGDGTFDDVTKEVFKHTSWFSMGSDLADINNDGLTDLFTVDMSGTSHYLSKILMGDMSDQKDFLDTAEPRQYMRNFLHVHAGLRTEISGGQQAKKLPCFLEAGQICGVASTDWSWAPVFGDFDCDEHVDLFVTNGHIRNFNDPDVFARQSKINGRTMWDIFRDEHPMRQPNIAFRNNGELHFDRATDQWNLGHTGISYAAASGDLDGDGDLDLVVMNVDERVSIYRNDIGEFNRVIIRLIGRQSNRNAIGARVLAETSTGLQVKEVNPYRGFLASHACEVHFGLGANDRIQKLTVQWPSGLVSQQTDVPANHLLVLVEPEDVVPDTLAETTTPDPLFQQMGDLNIRSHKEISFDDFFDQPLLPNKLSQLGPGVSVVDLDEDGTPAVWLAAASGQTPAIFVSESAGFSQCRLPGNADIEEMSALFLDFDGDGDRDAYIVSGGVESRGDDSLLQDRLLVNRGGLDFQLAEELALPHSPTSGSCVAAADFDRDGDLDLFVGGRVIPKKYPLAPPSSLLVNETTRADEILFREASSDIADFRDLGLVTSALWSDYNDDGWIDLLVATEWGPIHVFKNNQGNLQNVTANVGLDVHTGWWNGIVGRDLDNDGDIDYVATNFGQNTKYHATPERPVRIYYGRFGGGTEEQIIEAKVAEEGLLPIRGKSCSQNAMPFIAQKLPTYHDFASSTLLDIYDDNELSSARVFEVNQLNTSILWNQNGTFELAPLPWLAQVAPAFGVVATEVNGDAKADIFLVQNFYTPQRETGRMAGGLGALLLGKGERRFEALWPRDSGLFVTGDAKGLALSDMNHDHRPDFIVGFNNDSPRIYLNATHQHRVIAVRLLAESPNNEAIGARITVTLDDGTAQTAEVHAGGSYLSQSTADQFFGVSAGRSIESIQVRWPDGTVSKHRVDFDTSLVVLQQRKGDP